MESNCDCNDVEHNDLVKTIEPESFFSKLYYKFTNINASIKTGIEYKFQGLPYGYLTNFSRYAFNKFYDLILASKLSAPIAKWSSCSISKDGKYMSALSSYNLTDQQYLQNDGVWVSRDNGTSWIQRYHSNMKWTDIAVSSSGQYQTALSSYMGDGLLGGIWVSNDYGENFIFKQINDRNISASSLQWSSISMSGDGKYQLVTETVFGNIYISKDYGQTWDKITSLTGKNFKSIYINNNRTNNISEYYILATAGYPSQGAWRSIDLGRTWTQITNINGNFISGCCMSDDGSFQTIISSYSNINGITQPKVWYSTNYGMTWMVSNITADFNGKVLTNISMTQDGKTQYISSSTGYIFYSSDYGQNWRILIKNNNFIKNWTSICTNDNNSYTLTAGYLDYLYIIY